VKTAAAVGFPLGLAILLLSSCGKVGAPLPPIVRIPEKVGTLVADQAGDEVILTWTNPAKYIDGNEASDLGVVHIFRNDVEIGTVEAKGAGQSQSYAVNVAGNSGTSAVYTIQMILPKARRTPPVSNPAPFRTVEVPGAPRDVVPTVDKGEIVLDWKAPERHPELVDAYRVQRSDRAAPETVRTPQFRDTDYEAGKAYRYTITAMRADPPVPGAGTASLTVEATDKVPPARPTGVMVQLLGTHAFIQWTANTESDLKGYRVIRSDKPAGYIPAGPTTGTFDPEDHVPGKALTYQVVAEDDFGNLSLPSEPQPGP
jgi:hypothetical protein